MKFKIGIVLSGGGARGIAHLGILKAMEEFGIKPSIISGTSSGAIAGAFYAKGFTIKEILNIVKEGHFFSFSNILFPRQGFLSMNSFEKIYTQYFPGNSFSELNIPLYIAATDILNCSTVYFSEGDLSKSLLASSCIPVVFEPISYMETMFVDGGVLDNFPIEPLLNKCDKIIGIYVNSNKKELAEINMNNILDRSFHLAISDSVRNKVCKCNLYIEPPDMSQFSIFDIKKADEIYDYGYNYGLSIENKIKELIS